MAILLIFSMLVHGLLSKSLSNIDKDILENIFSDFNCKEITLNGKDAFNGKSLFLT